MTCREFKHMAASLTLWELARSHDGQVLDHAVECPECGTWLDRQQMLAVSMETLQTQTAGREAGPHVEQALLQVFRQEAYKTTQPVAALRSAPIAFRLSRFFELAVAAAIVVGLFLGVRLLEHRSATSLRQNQSAAVNPMPMQQTQSAGNTQQQAVTPFKREVVVQPASQNGSGKRPIVVAAPQTSDDADYVALMFCDPLICSSDVQVVRMELPVAGTSDRDAQTQMADVVVGDDGVVRAMRIVDASSN
jgi:putative intracellular protease/amidase